MFSQYTCTYCGQIIGSVLEAPHNCKRPIPKVIKTSEMYNMITKLEEGQESYAYLKRLTMPPLEHKWKRIDSNIQLQCEKCLVIINHDNRQALHSPCDKKHIWTKEQEDVIIGLCARISELESRLELVAQDARRSMSTWQIGVWTQ